MGIAYLYCQQPVLQVIHQPLVVILGSSQSPGSGNKEHKHRLHCEQLSFFVCPAFSSPSLTCAELPSEPRTLSYEPLSVTAREKRWGGRRERAEAAVRVSNYLTAVTLLECFHKLSGRSSESLSPLPSSGSECAALALRGCSDCAHSPRHVNGY